MESTHPRLAELLYEAVHHADESVEYDELLGTSDKGEQRGTSVAASSARYHPGVFLCTLAMLGNPCQAKGVTTRERRRCPTARSSPSARLSPS